MIFVIGFLRRWGNFFNQIFQNFIIDIFCEDNFIKLQKRFKEPYHRVAFCEQLTAREVEKDPRRNRAPHFLCGSLTEEESTLTINTPLPDTPFPMKKSLNEWSNAPRTIRGYLAKSNQARRAKEQMSKGQPSDSQTLGELYPIPLHSFFSFVCIFS